MVQRHCCSRVRNHASSGFGGRVQGSDSSSGTCRSQINVKKTVKIALVAAFDLQQIVAQGISPALLEWNGIEATEILADS